MGSLILDCICLSVLCNLLCGGGGYKNKKKERSRVGSRIDPLSLKISKNEN